jgi:L-fucose mutarotase/ribose pyranase (RbsD/FucU family)
MLEMKRFTILATVVLGFFSLTASITAQQVSIDQALEKNLNLYGHRNWIVIADSAYPAQSSPGVETLHVGGGQVDALKKVLAHLSQTKHVQPVIHVDAELKHLDNKLAPGVEEFRDTLTALLDKSRVEQIPHEQIIKKLDEAGKTFRVLILKTDAVLPYTSVFIQLDCGYWSPEKEAVLRKRMQ